MPFALIKTQGGGKEDSASSPPPLKEVSFCDFVVAGINDESPSRLLFYCRNLYMPARFNRARQYALSSEVAFINLFFIT
jgi:hypothetical protein